MKRQTAGRIVVLNGTSNSGKSLLANALEKSVPDRYEVVGLDRWLQNVAPDLFVVIDHLDHLPVKGWLIPMRDGVLLARPTLGPAALEVLREMYANFAARADMGTNLIVDDVLWHQAALSLAIDYFADRDAWLIGVLCPTAIAIERESRRTDRAKGGAALFAEVVHNHGVYDFTVDTSVFTPEQAAQAVRAGLSSGMGPRAFRELRSRRESSSEAHNLKRSRASGWRLRTARRRGRG